MLKRESKQTISPDKSVEDLIAGLRADNNALSAENENLKSDISKFEKHRKAKESGLLYSLAQVNWYENELADVYKSKTWLTGAKLGTFYYEFVKGGLKVKFRYICKVFKVIGLAFSLKIKKLFLGEVRFDARKKWYCGQRQQHVYTWGNIYSGYRRGLISVVLPVYNHSEFLESSIDSVLAQAYPNFELIIVDDGSTDNTNVVFEKYTKDKRVKIVTHTKNSKLPNALNTGFKYAEGEYLTWTSSDNMMKPDMLGSLKGYLDYNPGVHLVCADMEIIDSDGDLMPGWTDPGSSIVHPRIPVSELNTKWNVVGACFMYRHYVAKITGNYNPALNGAEDYDYWMRINNVFNVSRLSDKKVSYYKYRWHPASMTADMAGEEINEVVEKLKKIDEGRRKLVDQCLNVISVKGWDRIGEKEIADCWKDTCLNHNSSDGDGKNLMVVVYSGEESLLFPTGSLEDLGGDTVSLLAIPAERGDFSAEELEVSVLEKFDWVFVEDYALFYSLKPLHDNVILFPNLADIGFLLNSIVSSTISSRKHLEYPYKYVEHEMKETLVS